MNIIWELGYCLSSSLMKKNKIINRAKRKCIHHSFDNLNHVGSKGENKEQHLPFLLKPSIKKAGYIPDYKTL